MNNKKIARELVKIAESLVTKKAAPRPGKPSVSSSVSRAIMEMNDTVMALENPEGSKPPAALIKQVISKLESILHHMER